LLFLISLMSAAMFAQEYPTKPVRIIEPFGADGGVDVIARAVSRKLSEMWNQPVAIENDPGAGSTEAPNLSEVVIRWLYIARKHQRLLIQCRILEEPAV